MTDKRAPEGIDRRSFLKGAAAAGAISVAVGKASAAADAQAATEAKPAGLPSEKFITNPGSDFMCDVLKAVGFQYLAINPAAGFRSLQESIINYGGNRNPEILTCLHEEVAVALAHGYAKACGKPLGVMVHGTVGLQHAAMGLYNAWCDRVPVMVIAGNGINADTRRPGVEWIHSVQDPAGMVRDYTKWDDQPASLAHFAESVVRAYKYMMTAPMEPVMITCDMDLQEEAPHVRRKLAIPKITPPRQPQGDSSALRDAAKLLAEADKPLIVTDRATRSQAGVLNLVALAEALGAPVLDLGGRMNFPTTHDLELNFMRQSLVRDADVILLLEVNDPWNIVNSFDDPYKITRRVAKPAAKLISIGMQEVYQKSNYQDIQRFQPVDLAVGGDVEASLPDLVEQVTRVMHGRGDLVEQRRATYRKMHDQMKARDREASTLGWDASPISTARLAAETYNAIRREKWALVSDRIPWSRRLWPMTEHHQYLGGSGGAGLGYTSGSSIGAALANRDRGIFTVTFQGDGDLMYTPGSLWTAAHHKIPLLFVMHNNRCYHQEIMHIQRMAAIHNRTQTTAHIGTAIRDPNIDFAKLAQSLGVWAEGPVEDPSKLGAALRRAVAEVKNGRPALVDAVCQGR
jgi:thiamine pyrophosphate-dependent acetolactate synthase large subunit-like protein